VHEYLEVDFEEFHTEDRMQTQSTALMNKFQPDIAPRPPELFSHNRLTLASVWLASGDMSGWG
jgi:hypothetical protein